MGHGEELVADSEARVARIRAGMLGTPITPFSDLVQVTV